MTLAAFRAIANFLMIDSSRIANDSVIELMKTYVSFQESGNIRAFLALMLAFGNGATLHRLANDSA